MYHSVCQIGVLESIRKIFMKRFNTLFTAVLLVSLAACSKKESTSPSEQTPATVKKSKIDMFCQTWTLAETYENGQMKTSGGTEKYQFTRQGKFKFLDNSSWTDIGTFDFPKDSASFKVYFMGTSTPVVMTLKTLNDTDLKTEFSSGGKTLNYNYKR